MPGHNRPATPQRRRATVETVGSKAGFSLHHFPEPSGDASKDGNWMGSLGLQPLLLLVFFAAMYFLMIAPNQKKQKKWQQMLSELKNGDRVTTNGGIRGTIVSVKDDVVQLRIPPDNIKLEFVKSAIAAVTTPDA
jgi:preprotein translocase subunit YajC